MGGPGSGGYKTSPGDTETHSAWDIIAQDPDSGQVCLTFTMMPHSNRSNITATMDTNAPKCERSQANHEVLEIGPSTMQVLYSGDGAAYVSPKGSPPDLRTIP